LQKLGQKPVGFKIVVSRVDEVEALVQEMINLDIYPNFITVDGGEGGTNSNNSFGLLMKSKRLGELIVL
jgi:glutamate synthase domain-containing protein 2